MAEPYDFQDRVCRLLARITFPGGMAFEANLEGDRVNLRCYTMMYDAKLTRAEIMLTSPPKVRQNGRWWRLSSHMTDGQIVQTAFKAVLTFLEHEARESFRVDGLQVMQPHWSLDALISMARDRSATQERS